MAAKMDKAFNYALKILGMKPYFTCEIIKKVSERFNYDEAILVAEKLKGYGYLDDERTANNYISYKLRSGYGANYIRNKLYEKGVSITLSDIEQVQFDEDVDIEEKVLKIVKKYQDDTRLNQEKAYRRCVSALQNKGFLHNQYMKLIKFEGFKR